MTGFQNHILQALGDEASKALTAKGALVNLPFKTDIYLAGSPVDYVYFPEGCLFSLVRTSSDAKTVESGLCGYEGAVGLIEACGSRVASATTIVQVPGKAWRIPYMACADMAFKGGRPTRIFFSNAEYLSIEARQSALCRSFHHAPARMARWIIEYQRRSATGDMIPITHELLADMLGIQRTTITAVAHSLKVAGLIKYMRGRLTVVNFQGLERVACECIRTLDEERVRLRGSLP